MDDRPHPGVDFGVACTPLPGQPVTGDKYVMLPDRNGVLLGVVDGLGHGIEAAQAADLAVQAITQHAGASLQDLIQKSHTALRRTRGVAMTLVSLDLERSTMSWIGVGNVEAVLVPAEAGGRQQVPLLMGGVVGHQLPRLKVNQHPLSPGDLIILVTDGIDRAFAERVIASEGPQEIADALLENSRKGNDDALVLAVRYLGAEQ